MRDREKVLALLAGLVSGRAEAIESEQLEALVEAISGDSDQCRRVALYLAEQLARRNEALKKAEEKLSELEKRLDELTAPPLYPATFLGLVPIHGEPHALVHFSLGERVVRVSKDVEVTTLQPGCRVLLDKEWNLVLGTVPADGYRTGHICTFVKRLGEKHALIRAQGEESIVLLAPPASGQNLMPGDGLRWDRDAKVAFEKIDIFADAEFVLYEVPDVTFDSIGGLDSQIALIKRQLTIRYKHAELAKQYSLKPAGSVLLVGPPGNGKTMLAKALANWLAQLSGVDRPVFMNIKPSALHTCWYGESEANYRKVFAAGRELALRTPNVPVVMFFDEVDAIGGMRGQTYHRVDDRVIAAFLAELDGIAERGNILVIGATNRMTELDPALIRPGRFGDLVVEVPRPTQLAAREILAKHLPDGCQYSLDGGAGGLHTKHELIDAIVSRIYAPNGLPELAVITFRDATHRSVRAHELVSGAMLANIARKACERAFWRCLDGGGGAITLADLTAATEEELLVAVRNLTPANCRFYIDGLPQDLDPVRVEVYARRLGKRARILAREF